MSALPGPQPRTRYQGAGRRTQHDPDHDPQPRTRDQGASRPGAEPLRSSPTRSRGVTLTRRRPIREPVAAHRFRHLSPKRIPAPRQRPPRRSPPEDAGLVRRHKRTGTAPATPQTLSPRRCRPRSPPQTHQRRASDPPDALPQKMQASFAATNAPAPRQRPPRRSPPEDAGLVRRHKRTSAAPATPQTLSLRRCGCRRSGRQLRLRSIAS